MPSLDEKAQVRDIVYNIYRVGFDQLPVKHSASIESLILALKKDFPMEVAQGESLARVFRDRTRWVDDDFDGDEEWLEIDEY